MNSLMFMNEFLLSIVSICITFNVIVLLVLSDHFSLAFTCLSSLRSMFLFPILNTSLQLHLYAFEK